jgi:hypothetical protein
MGSWAFFYLVQIEKLKSYPPFSVNTWSYEYTVQVESLSAISRPDWSISLSGKAT